MRSWSPSVPNPQLRRCARRASPPATPCSASWRPRNPVSWPSCRYPSSGTAWPACSLPAAGANCRTLRSIPGSVRSTPPIGSKPLTTTAPPSRRAISPRECSPTCSAASSAPRSPYSRSSAGLAVSRAVASFSVAPSLCTRCTTALLPARRRKRRSPVCAELARVLGVDYGQRRVGLALSDPTATIAQPLTVLVRRAGKRPPVQAIVDLVAQHEVAHLVVGLPLTLEG